MLLLFDHSSYTSQFVERVRCAGTAPGDFREALGKNSLGRGRGHRGDRRSGTTRQIRETEAEATAFVVCHGIGLETGSAASDYIQLWQGDARLLTESLAYVQRATSQILAALTVEFKVNPHTLT